MSDRVKGLDLVADDYLTKPFSLTELLARVRPVTRCRTRPVESVLRVGELTTDRVQRTVTRSGQTITLTPKEFALLEYPMRNAGRPVSRSMSIEHVWNLGFDTTINVVDVYIIYLRKKIGGESAAKMIRTVRGVGYQIDAADGSETQSPQPIAQA